MKHFMYREPTMDILTKKWSETVENSTRYDCIVLSPTRVGAKLTRGVGAGGRRMVLGTRCEPLDFGFRLRWRF